MQADLKEILAERDATLVSLRYDNSEFQLKASLTKDLRILFDEPWIVEMTHHRLKGELPVDREGHILIALPGKLVLVGGQGKTESIGRETWTLDLESFRWDAPASARLNWTTVQGTCAPLGRTKARSGHSFSNSVFFF